MRKLTLLLFVLIACIPYQTAGAAGLNDFRITNFDIAYVLGRNTAGYSTLSTTETIQAEFSQQDINHGIERSIPNTYDGHKTHVTVQSVVDANNSPLPFTIYTANDNSFVQIGSADTYVHGTQVYKLTYEQTEVTRYFADTNDDEFYWDTNGTDWKVPIDTLHVSIALNPSIATSATGKAACYSGAYGKVGTCTPTKTANGYEITQTNLLPFDNVSVSIGFKPMTFAMHKVSPLEKAVAIWKKSLLVTTPLGVALFIYYVLQYGRRSNRTKEIGTIIPEYVAPANTSISVSASISRKSQYVLSAQLVDLAVRGYLSITQTQKKSFLQAADFELQIIRNVTDLKEEEKELLSDLFPSLTEGSVLRISDLKSDYKLSTRLADNPRKLKNAIAGGYGLRAKDPVQSRWFRRAAGITALAGVVTLSPALLVAALFALIYGQIIKPLTDLGLSLARYLKGLEMYMKVAEADRIRMLQSPEAAARIGTINIADNSVLLKLYESLLPYAIIFGQEKNWSNQLAFYYQSTNQSPYWFNGTDGVFTAAILSSAISDFNSSTFSSSVSSSSGGSGGGGFSGGGGGGGGGGGW